MLILLLPVALAAQHVLSPGDAAITGFDGDETAVWMDYATECGIQLFDWPADLAGPLELTQVRIAFSSADGALDHHASSVALALKVISDDEVPTGLYGIYVWDWTETWFELAISSTHLTAISLTNDLPPTWPMTWEGGRVAVFLCPTDPELALSWGEDSDGGVLAGLVADPDLAGSHSYIWRRPDVLRLDEAGIAGGWAVQVVVDDGVEGPGVGLSGIDPSSTLLGEVAEVQLQGTGFDAEVQAFLGGLAIAGLEWVDDETLAGRSPSGLPVGRHDLRVVAADGAEALLTLAFEVLAPEEDADPTDTGDGAAGSTGGGCGCASGGSAGVAWLAALAAVGLRRLRTRPR